MAFRKNASLAMLLATVSVTSQSACANDDLTVNVGLRLWNNNWTSWDVYPPFGSGAIPGASENFTSSSETALIPTISVRYKDFLVSGSHFVDRGFDFDGVSGNKFSSDRQETDFLIGYYVLPSLALTLGYKDVKQDFGGTAQFKYSGPMLGVAASAPLTQGFSLYGSFGYGFMDAKLPVGMAALEANGKTALDVNYMLGEVGVAYSIDVSSLLPGAKGMAITLGYRNQVLNTKDFSVRVSDVNPALQRNTDLRDTTEGLALGVSVSF